MDFIEFPAGFCFLFTNLISDQRISKHSNRMYCFFLASNDIEAIFLVCSKTFTGNRFLFQALLINEIGKGLRAGYDLLFKEQKIKAYVKVFHSKEL